MSEEEGGEITTPSTRPPSSASKSRSAKSTGPESSGLVTKNQQLFLVEFLVDTVTLDPNGISEDLADAQTCVTLKFLTFPPMTVCEKDFDPDREPGVDKIRFNSGKSLMFAFSEKQCEDPPPIMAELVVSKNPADAEKVDMGSIKVCMAQLFQQVYEVAKFTPDKLPSSRSIKDCFMLIGRGKRTTGEIGVYIRLTCLGQNVVTEFQCGSNMRADPVLFKNREGKKVYEFTGADGFDENGNEGGGPGGRPPKGREGCGCIRPVLGVGGQGDGAPGRPGPAPNIGKDGRVVLDMPDNTRNQNGSKAPNRNRPPPGGTGTSYPMGGDSKCGQNLGGGLTLSKVPVNPDQNCFVLRVGDKGKIPDRGKMILEFRTPKQKIPPKVLPPYHEDVAVQTETPKGKGKGKKGKR